MIDSPSTRTTLHDLADLGVSVWLDDLNRPMITSGDLARYIDRGVRGMTTNPTIFANALSEGNAYDEQLSTLTGQNADEAVFTLTTEDVRSACDIFAPLFADSDGVDGRVSIEVEPSLAADTAGSVAMGKRLWAAVDRPNLFIKVPATLEGLPAISQLLAEGISVNVTLIFALDRYRGVMNAFLTGLEQAREKGLDLSTIHSVASFFVSRVDTEVDARLEKIGSPEALGLRGKAGVANAQLAYQAFEEVFGTPRWQNLADDGAHVQRPLWASTGVKNPDYPDTLYVTELVAPHTVNTMPDKTMEATIDHAELRGDTVTGSYAEAQQVLDDLERVGVSYNDVVELLETEGVEKFDKSWSELLEQVQGQLAKTEGATDASTADDGPAGDA
ncbi:MAG: transaldolase [Ornithinimicrobium sp.]|uniref:transaldolase n=1 Tax=Ornithinimicrobium sp. TaxID=1977084 RepID=UPI0026E06748|nr:transaldolase [Ornithinimicrobium sp.]MDO5738669.1 transaldolase [Ornithinimicrobium sp.]